MTGSQRRSVWVVDDSPTEAAHAARCLDRIYDVRIFSDGATALEALATETPPDVLALDWVMPGVTGINVCRFLRETPTRSEFHRVAVLLLTVHHRTEQVVEGLSAGANDFLSKPYSDEELVARVGALVRSVELLERAERAEGVLARLLAITPDAILSLDEERTITFANASAERIFQRPAESLVGLPIADLLPTVLEADPAKARRDITLHDRVYAPSLGALADGEVHVLSLRDVTEQRRVEARRLDLYSIIAHDLRSPLNSLYLRNELLKEEAGAEATGRALEKSQVTIRGMVALINDFLDVARLENGSLQTERELVALEEVVDQCLDDFEQIAAAGRIALRAETGASAQVRGDRRGLLQVMTNLVSNAIKFTPPGGRVVVSLDREGTNARLSVRDSGRGIVEKDLPQLFKRYSRPRGASQGVEGTGLGLMIVRELVEAFGGRVEVTSEVGQGSTFCVLLPLA
jgi:signal transduction histidine kinase